MRTVFLERTEGAPCARYGKVAGWVFVWLPALLASLSIAWESTPTFSANHTDGWLRPLFEHWFGHIDGHVWWWAHHIFRKGGHFFGYGLVALTFLRAWLWTLVRLPLPAWLWRLRAVVLAVVATAIVASLDEWHQTYLPSRTGQASDVVLDTVGATLFCGAWALVWWRQARRRAGVERDWRVSPA